MPRSLVGFVLLFTVTTSRADQLVLVAGGGTKPDLAPGTEVTVTNPFSVDFADDGTIYFVEMTKGERLRCLRTDGIVETLAGTGVKGNTGDNGPGKIATFNGMHNLLVGLEGKIYLADSFNNTIRVYDTKTKTVTRFAGTGEAAYGDDGGPAVNAKFSNAICIAFNSDKSAMYLADISNRRVRKIDMKTNIVTTVAGTGAKGIPKDGELAAKQPLVDPRAVTVDAKGNIYVLERGGHALRMIDTEGRIRTVAGTGMAGKGGVSGPALKAQMNGPKFLCVDRDGSVLICDTENHRVLRYKPDGNTMEAVAGTGEKGKAGVGGDPLKAQLNQPHGVAVHPKTSAIYISDASNNRIVKVER